MGEKSKRSGEIGEKISSQLLAKIGWGSLMHNMTIDCNTPATHRTEKDTPRETHGEDHVFLYHSPFHDDRTDVIHVSDKNVFDNHVQSKLRTNFRSHIKELSQTIECAKYSPKMRQICSSFKARKTIYHSGLLVWIHNDDEDIERDIKEHISGSRLDGIGDYPIYLIDNARASFLLSVVEDLARRDGSFKFYYPRIGTSITVDEKRSDTYLPVEMIAADIIPALVSRGDSLEFVLYADQSFSPETYKQILAYGLNFSAGLVGKVSIGMRDYNPAQDKEAADLVRLSFHERQEQVTPFSFKRSILDLLVE